MKSLNLVKTELLIIANELLSNAEGKENNDLKKLSQQLHDIVVHDLTPTPTENKTQCGIFVEIVHPAEEFHLLPFEKLENIEDHRLSVDLSNFRKHQYKFSITYNEENNKNIDFHTWIVPEAISKKMEALKEDLIESGREEIRNKLTKLLGIDEKLNALESKIDDLEIDE